MAYSKEDSEYISNGHYEIDGVSFMSIWTFKNEHGITPNNNWVNGDQGKELIDNGVSSFDSKPDFGNFDTIQIYPVSDLEDFFDI